MNESSAAPASSDFLLRMAASSRQRLASARANCDEAEMRRLAERQLASTPLILSEHGFDLIAEVKRRSPSVGSLTSIERPPSVQAKSYLEAGAAAISVLTEPEQFSGELAHLTQVVNDVTTIPVMRKDFLVSSYQVLEARAAGAGGVLLIAALLDRAKLRDMLQTALDLGMFVLVEVFDVDDLDMCLPILAESGAAMLNLDNSVAGRSGSQCRIMIGVNCRDLRTLQVDFPRFERLVSRLPDAVPWVAESGVATPARAAEVAGLGYRLALVGTALMQSGDPAAAAREMLIAGRHGAGTS